MYESRLLFDYVSSDLSFQVLVIIILSSGLMCFCYELAFNGSEKTHYRNIIAFVISINNIH